MALAANTVISHNRTLNFLSFPLPKLGNAALYHCHSKANSLHTCSQSRQVYQCSSRTSTTSSVAKSALSDVQLHSSNSTTATASNSWLEFSRNVSGEWDGYGADFSSDGNPIELPESVVPEAYREWEVKVYDWQTQCPTLAQQEDNSMIYKSIKLLPTVGCEADAATQYSIDERNIGGVDNKVSAFAYHSSGSYVALWPRVDSKLLELEYCLINPLDKESRVRIIQVFRVDGTNITMQNVKVFCEQWYGPFRNADQLGGCAIRDSGFASTATIKATEIVGEWQGTKVVANLDDSRNNIFQELQDDGLLKSVRNVSNLVLLPRQLWCSLKENDGETCSEVGWLFDQGCALTSKCIFSSEVKLKEVTLVCQTRALDCV